MSKQMMPRKLPAIFIIDWFTYLKIVRLINDKEDFKKIKERYIKSNIQIKFSNIYYKLFDFDDIFEQFYNFSYFDNKKFKIQPYCINDKSVFMIDFSENKINFNSNKIISNNFKIKILQIIFSNNTFDFSIFLY